jgi:hypothetical protein
LWWIRGAFNNPDSRSLNSVFSPPFISGPIFHQEYGLCSLVRFLQVSSRSRSVLSTSCREGKPVLAHHRWGDIDPHQSMLSELSPEVECAHYMEGVCGLVSGYSAISTIFGNTSVFSVACRLPRATRARGKDHWQDGSQRSAWFKDCWSGDTRWQTPG